MSKENYASEKITAWSYDMEGHADKCVDKYCESAQKDVSTLQLVATPCIDDHQTPPGDCEKTAEPSAVCAQIVLKFLYLARIGRPYFCCQQIPLQDQRQNGTKLETKDFYG